jgi:hypothetical protein
MKFQNIFRMPELLIEELATLELWRMRTGALPERLIGCLQGNQWFSRKAVQKYSCCQYLFVMRI